MKQYFEKAKAASRAVALLSDERINHVLLRMADTIIDNKE